MTGLVQFVTPRQVAQALRMPWAAARDLLEERGVRFAQFGKRIRIPKSAVEELVADSTMLNRGEQRDRADAIRIESVRARRGDAEAEAFAARIARRRKSPEQQATA